MIYWSKLPPPPTSITLTNALVPTSSTPGSERFVLDTEREKTDWKSDWLGILIAQRRAKGLSVCVCPLVPLTVCTEQFVPLSICLSVPLSACQFIPLFIFLSVCSYIVYPSLYLEVCPSVCVCSSVTICQSVSSFNCICLSVCLSVCHIPPGITSPLNHPLQSVFRHLSCRPH